MSLLNSENFSQLLSDEDEIFLTALYNHCLPSSIYKIVKYTNGNYERDIVEDLFSKAFSKLIAGVRAGNKFDHVNKVRKYLTLTAFNSYRNHLKTSKNKKHISLDSLLDSKKVSSEEEDFNLELDKRLSSFDDSNFREENKELLQRVVICLEQMKQPCRDLLGYRFLSNFKWKEVAELLGMSYDNVRQKQKSCIEKYKKLIKESK